MEIHGMRQNKKQDKDYKRMKIIGITGGIGSGKSAVLDLLEKKYNAYIVETDKLAHRLMEPGQDAYNQIVKEFGREILSEDGKINRQVLGGIVFQDARALKGLNGIVHPAVKRYIQTEIEEKRKENKTAVYVVEAALLIEDGYRLICDELWYIHAEKEKRIQRLLLGRGGNREKWENIMKNQSSDEYYRENCDVVIDNGKNLEWTDMQINRLLSK